MPAAAIRGKRLTEKRRRARLGIQDAAWKVPRSFEYSAGGNFIVFVPAENALKARAALLPPRSLKSARRSILGDERGNMSRREGSDLAASPRYYLPLQERELIWAARPQ